MPERCDILASRNPHPRDSRIEYVDETHSYFLDGNLLPLSVTGLWGQYFPHFDADACMDKYFDAWSKDPTNKYHQLVKYLSIVCKLDVTGQRDAIKQLWACNGNDASEAGTYMHMDIEYYFNDLPPSNGDSPEFQHFLKWWKGFMPGAGVIAYRTEFSIYDEEAQVAGQIDCLLRTEDGLYVMVDWKRCNPSPRRAGQPKELLGPDQRAFGNEKGTGPCSDLANTSFWHYVVQQRLYTRILEQHYDIKVDSSWLVQLHPSLSEAHCVECPRIDDIIDEIMERRYEEVRAKRAKTSKTSKDEGGDAI